MRAIIVGGGVAGPALALFLKHIGVTATISKRTVEETALRWPRRGMFESEVVFRSHPTGWAS